MERTSKEPSHETPLSLTAWAENNIEVEVSLRFSANGLVLLKKKKTRAKKVF